MAGYVTKLVGHVFDGSHFSAEALENGMFAAIDPATQKVKKTTANGDLVMVVAAKEDLWGMNALRCDVVVGSTDGVYFVENEWRIDNTQEYDTAKYVLPVGKLVKMKILLPGEQVIVTVPDALFNSVAVGAQVTSGAGGLVVAV